jgi:predicted alpha/beta hydrolase family esterase
MKNAILLHGLQDKSEYYKESFPAPGNAHWFPWLQKQLLVRDIYTETPTVPFVFKATYEDWKNAFERSYKIDKDTLLVGHSCGGGFLIRWLSENPNINVGKIILVAPWLDPFEDQHYKVEGLFDFTIDENLSNRVGEIQLFLSLDDHRSILETSKIIEDNIPSVNIVKFENKGHFCYSDLGGEEFPELLAECIK